MITKYLFDHISFYKLQKRFFQCIQRTRKLDFKRRFSIHKFYGAVKKLTDIIDASPYFRNPAVNFEKSIDSFHCCTHRILCREHSISRSLCKLSKECKVDASIRNNIRAVTFRTRHEKCCNIRHHGRYTDCTVFCQIHDLIFRYTKMIEPFSGDFFSGTVFHRFLDIISRYICK